MKEAIEEIEKNIEELNKKIESFSIVENDLIFLGPILSRIYKVSHQKRRWLNYFLSLRAMKLQS